MARSSTTHKTKAPPQVKTGSSAATKTETPGRTHDGRHKTPAEQHPSRHMVVRSHVTSKKPISHHRPVARTSAFAINRQSKKTNRAKAWRGWLLVTLAIAAIVVICVMTAYKLLQHTGEHTSLSQPDSTASSSADKPEVIESLPREPTDLAKAQERLTSISSSLEQTNFSATTVIKLKVPLYKQTYGQSCEASALRMALAYRSVTTTDMALLNQMGYDGVVAKTVNGKLIWTDPHKQFVGDKDGDQQKLTGYGVFAEPIAAASDKNGRPAEAKDDVQIDWIVSQLYAGNPVIVWGVSIKISDTVWYTEDGATVNAPLRTHTRLVTGFKGDPSDPDGFYLNDPATGTEKYWTTVALKTDISKGIKQAVAVY